jgi:hypothetical protein
LTRRRLLAALVVACSAAGVAHALATWPHYHVGSFDDDAGYVMVARALAHGRGLTSTLPAGVPLVASYPPGYAALLAPIAVVSGTAFAAFRATSVVLLALLFPLVWVYLRGRGLGPVPSLAVLVLLALNPPLGTFGMMVMAEVAFLVVLMIVLLALDRWERDAQVLTWSAAMTVVGAAGLLWLKEAGAGLVLGMVLWLLLRRLRTRAALLAAGVAVLFAPVLVARQVSGVSLLGSRYANEFGTAFAGGLVHIVAHALSTYANVALPQTLVPTSVSPLPIFGWAAGALGTFGTLSAPLVLIGFVVWCRRHPDVTCVAVPLYVLITLAYPYTNERRVLLVLPVVVAWYVLGWAAVIAWVRAHVPVVQPVAWAAPLVALVILVPQFGRDYLYLLGHGSSRPRGSPYAAFLTAAGSHRDLVETDYVWTVSLLTGHRTAATAFFNATDHDCAPSSMLAGLVADRPSYLLTAALSNVPGPGSPCLLAYVAADPSAVRLFRTAWDDASVFELVGPGTAHPDLADLTAAAPPSGAKVGLFQALPQGPGDPGGPYPIVTPVGGEAVVTWDWGSVRTVTQISVGMAFAPLGRVQDVAVQLAVAGGGWETVSDVRGAIGDTGVVPFLLHPLARPVPASALRVVVHTDADVPVYVLDTHAVGRA